MELEENSNLVKLQLYIHFGEEYHYKFRLIRWIRTFNLGLKDSKYGIQFIYVIKKTIQILRRY